MRINLKNKKFLHIAGWTLLVSVLVIILGAMMYLISTTQRVVDIPTEQSQTAGLDTDGTGSIGLEELGIDIDADLEASLAASDIATLDSVRGVEELGVAIRSNQNGVFNIEVLVSSPPAQSGKIYKVWLLGSETLSIGALMLDEAEPNSYILTYSSEKDLSGFTKVAITEEPSSDVTGIKSETNTLEGSF